MQVANVTAIADIVGRRLRVGWEVVPEGVETLADAPPVRLRRKLRDFDFPQPIADDPYLVYDATEFPPAPGAALQVIDLPGWEADTPAGHTVYSAISVAAPFQGRFVEILRRTLGTTFDTAGVAVRQSVEILDLGGAPGALVPATTYYYELSAATVPLPPVDDPASYRAAAAPTDSFGTNRTLYEMLPAVFRRHDVVARPAGPGADTVPEASPRSGQLRRFVDLFGIGFDSLRSSAEAIRTLHDVDNVDARWLPALAQWIGWDLSYTAGVPLQRNEIKSASRLYRSVGTVPGIRAIVSQYTGWFTQVAEFVQSIARSNDAPSYNLFAAAEVEGSWVGTDDAAAALGFGPGNGEATGAGSAPATLTGAVEPFALRSGMVLTVSVDGQLAVGVRFEADDFADLGTASCAEVVDVLNRAFYELTAVASGGRVVLASNSVGSQSTIRVEQRGASLVTLESAPGGRLAVFRDAGGRARLFYETTDAPAGAQVDRRLRYKTLVDGTWRGSRQVSPAPVRPQGSPAAIELPAGPLLLGWVDDPGTARSRLRFAFGRNRAALPARLVGRRREPFALIAGARLRLTGDVAAETFTVNAAAFFDLAHATAAEVAAAMNAQLTHAHASAVNGTLRLDGTSTGPRARLAIDLGASTSARALGFDPSNAAAVGAWDDTIDWDPELTGPAVPSGRHDDLCVVADPLGGARIFWSHHRVADSLPRWILTTARWDGGTWIASAAGASVRSPGGTWTQLTTSAGLGSNDVREIALDADGAVWFATAAGATVRRPGGAFARFATGDGLASNDVRAIAVDPAGSVWFATAAGVSVRSPGGGFATFTTAAGLGSNDTRGLAIDAAGGVWVATAAGASYRSVAGTWSSIPTSALPSPDVRAVRVDGDGIVWLATAAGALAWDGATARLVAETPTGDDTRDVAVAADGTLWLATGSGVKTRSPAGDWRSFGIASGLPSNDVRSISVLPDGAVWAATSAGLGVRAADELWRIVDTGSGTPGRDVRAIHGPWSAPFELVTAGSGDREPCAVVDGSQRTWVIWSQRPAAAGADDPWLLRFRRFDPANGWTADAALTVPPVGARAADREPAAILGADGDLRVFFRSDRSGGPRLWSVSLTSAGVAGAPTALPDEPSADRTPAPLALGPGAPLWLVFRSDRNVALGQVAAGRPTSTRLPDDGAIRRYAGTTTVVTADLVRNRQRRLWGDVLAYTPQKPLGSLDPLGQALGDDDRYTRGTIGIFASRGRLGNPLTVQEVARLRQLLSSFLPIHVRALLILAPSLDVEAIYPPGADLGEAYRDDYPFADHLTTLSDATHAALPQWSVLTANTTGHVSADPAQPATLRHRSYYRPPE